MLTIKEAADLVGKVPLTVRRAIYKAPKDKKNTNNKGHLLIDKEYLLDIFNVKTNEPEQSKVINDNSLLILSNELQNKQKTIDSLNDRLQEANMIIGDQRQQITGLSNTINDKVQLLIEAQEEVISDNTEVNTPIKKPFPLIEVISISACVIIATYIYLMYNK